MALRPTYIHIEPDGVIPEFLQSEPFKAIVVLEAESSQAWQGTVSEKLVTAGCRYVMAWGEQCEVFHDIVDRTSIDRHDYDVPAENFIMTTWHDNESLESVFWYSQFCADFSYDEVELQRSLIIHISRIGRETEYLDLFAHSKTLADRDEDEGSS